MSIKSRNEIKEWRLTGFYGSSYASSRDDSWEELQRFKSGISLFRGVFVMILMRFRMPLRINEVCHEMNGVWNYFVEFCKIVNYLIWATLVHGLLGKGGILLRIIFRNAWIVV